MAPTKFSEVELAMKMGILWGDWLKQPPEHRALYLAANEARHKMNAIDDGDRALQMHQASKRRG